MRIDLLGERELDSLIAGGKRRNNHYQLRGPTRQAVTLGKNVEIRLLAGALAKPILRYRAFRLRYGLLTRAHTR